MIRPVSVRSLVARFAVGVAVVAVLAVGATRSPAGPVSISGLNWTGIGGGSTDANWSVVAYPGTFPGTYTSGSPYVGPPSAPIVPYAAFIPSGGNPPTNVPGVFYGGISNDGPYDSRWIGLQADDVSSLWPGFVDPLAYQDYTTVYRTSFTASDTGSTFLSFLAAADNAVTFFVTDVNPTGGVDANIDYTNPWRPTVFGQEVAPQEYGLGSLHWVEGNVNVTLGTNYLYAVVRDTLKVEGPDGNYGFTALLVVPEPSSIVLAGFGAAGFALLTLRRRAKARG